MMDSASVLSTAHLRVQYGGVLALNVDRLEIPAIGTTAALLMGPNGAGKTTFLDVITGFVQPTNGATIRLHAQRELDITRASKVRRVRSGVVRTFQRPPVFRSLTVGETITLATRRSGMSRRRNAGDGGGQLFEALVEAVGVADILPRPAGLVPLHILRRVELARVLATEPRLLMLDEPTAGSDDCEREHLAELLNCALPKLVAHLHAAGQYRFPRLTSCVVTHDLKLATLLSMSHSPPVVHILAQGQLRASGNLRDLTQDGELRSSYFGGQ